MEGIAGQDEWCEKFVDTLGSIENKGDFCVSMAIGEKLPLLHPKITIDGSDDNRISFPLLSMQAERLRSMAEKAPYGKGHETVHDESVRKAWQIDAARVRFKHESQWAASLSGIVRTCVSQLGLTSQQQECCRANLYKMLLYEPGGHFKKHRDTEKEPGMFGTLVLQLPSRYSGGNLVIRHGGETKNIDLSKGSEDNFFATAFYADCEHELQPVTEGWRLALVYNLVLPSSPSMSLPSAENLTSQALQLRHLVREWPFPESKTARGYLLEHKYTETNLSFQNLKGRDKQVVDMLRGSCGTDGTPLFIVCLLLIEKRQSGEPSCDYGGYYRGRYDSSDEDDGDHQMGEVHDEETGPSLWIGPDGNRMGSCGLDFDLDCIFGYEDEVFGNDPDKEEYEGYTGNAGPSLEYWYYRSAVVFWPKSMNSRILSQAGTSYAVSYLKTAPLSEVLPVAQTVVESIESGRSTVTSDSLISILRARDESLLLRTIQKVRTIPDTRFSQAVVQILRDMGIRTHENLILNEIGNLIKRSISSAPSYSLLSVIQSAVAISKSTDLNPIADTDIGMDIKKHIMEGAISRKSGLLSSNQALDVIVPLILEGNESMLVAFITMVMDHGTPSQLKLVLASWVKNRGAISNSKVLRLFEKRLTQLVQLTGAGPPSFSWNQPNARFDGSQSSAVNTFLRSKEREKVFHGFTGISHARNWANKYWGNVYSSQGKGYSGTAVPGGRGSGAYVTVTKSSQAHQVDLEGYHANIKETKLLRSYLGARKHERNDPDIIELKNEKRPRLIHSEDVAEV